MSSIPAKKIDGDVAVGRNVSTGGKLKVAGSATIGHNLKVEGWLEAVNVKATNKGIFLTLEALKAAYPSPKDGWFAGVGSSTPFTAYVGKDGAWVATGGTIDVTVDMSQYTEDVAQLQEDIDDVKEAVAENKEALSAETTAREADVAQLRSETADVIKTIELTDLDSLAESREAAAAFANTVTNARWTVTSNGRKVGVLEVFSDGMRHQLTEVLTSNYVSWSNVSEHTDGAIYIYYRTYNINSTQMENKQGTWSAWKEVVPKTVSNWIEIFKAQTVVLTQAEYDALVASGEVENGTYYNILEDEE